MTDSYHGIGIMISGYELPRDQKLLDMAVLFPGGIIASDAMPWVSTRTGRFLRERPKARISDWLRYAAVSRGLPTGQSFRYCMIFSEILNSFDLP